MLLDDDLEPYPDDQQWDVLAAIRRIDPATVERDRRGRLAQGPCRRRSASRGQRGRQHRGATAVEQAPTRSRLRARCRSECRRSSRSGCSSRRQACRRRCINHIKRTAAVREPGVLQEAEHALVDGDDAARDLVRGSIANITSRFLAAAGPISRSSFASTVSRSTSTTSAPGDRARREFNGKLTSVQDGAHARCSRTTPACSSRHRASARP